MATPANPTPIHTAVEELLDQLRGAWRFRWVALGVAWCVAIALWILIFLIPNTYEASAQVFVQTQTTLSEATKGLSLGDNIDAQIEQMRESLLGGPQLRKVANETNLMAGAITPQAQQQVIDNLRSSIDISGQYSGGGSGAVLFKITDKDHDRGRALQVVEHLLNNFVEGALGSNQQGSQQTEQFLAAQLKDYGHKLSATEQRLAQFRRRNAGLLPGEQGDSFTQLQNDAQGLLQAKQNLDLAKRRLAALQEQLRTGQEFTAGSQAGAAAADPIATEIAETQQQLSQMLLKYTDKYPDVIALKQTLKELEARQKAEAAAAKRGDVGAANQLGLAANPVYQKLQEQYNAEEVEIASMQQDIADRQLRIARLRSMMNAAPEVQAQYTQLTRDYAVTKSQYDALLSRLDSTRLGQQAAATGVAKFQVIDPPTAQFKPVAPKRPLLIVVSLLASLGAGLGIAYLLHLLQPVFVSSRQLAATTGLTVLGEVGMAWIERHRLEARRGKVSYALGTLALVMLAVGVLALQAHISHFLTELRA